MKNTPLPNKLGKRSGTDNRVTVLFLVKIIDKVKSFLFDKDVHALPSLKKGACLFHSFYYASESKNKCLNVPKSKNNTTSNYHSVRKSESPKIP